MWGSGPPAFGAISQRKSPNSPRVTEPGATNPAAARFRPAVSTEVAGRKVALMAASWGRDKVPLGALLAPRWHPHREAAGEPGRIRTSDTQIKSLLFCR